jgi:hypothetical protein
VHSAPFLLAISIDTVALMVSDPAAVRHPRHRPVRTAGGPGIGIPASR